MKAAPLTGPSSRVRPKISYMRSFSHSAIFRSVPDKDSQLRNLGRQFQPGFAFAKSAGSHHSVGHVAEDIETPLILPFSYTGTKE